MKRLPVIACILLFVTNLVGCSAIPTGTRTTTTNDVDEQGRVVRQTVVEEDAAAQFAISPEMARMQQACYESFSAERVIPDNLAAQMDARAVENVYMFREFRLGLQQASGFDPREVCRSPASIYDYAIHHDEQLYATIRSGIRDVKDAAIATTPWFKVADMVGDLVGAVGSKTDIKVEGDATMKDVANDKRVTTPGVGSLAQIENDTSKDATAEGEGASATGASGIDAQQPSGTTSETHTTTTDTL